MQPNNPQRPQFFDVVRPGRTPASPTSRPVLPNNRPAVQDTSMKMGAPAVPAGLMAKQAAPSVPQLAPAPMRPPTQPRPVTMPTAPAPWTPANASARQPLQQRFGVVDPSPQTISPAQETVTPPVLQAPQHTAQYAKHSIWSEVLAVLAILILVALIINILLDAEIINLPLPHTNFFDY